MSNYEYDSIPLMKQIARMANMEYAGIQKMVLVLEVDEVPRLYVQSLVNKDKSELLCEVNLDPIPVVDVEVDFGACDVRVIKEEDNDNRGID